MIDLPQIIAAASGNLVWPALLLVLVIVGRSRWAKGVVGELLVKAMVRLRLGEPYCAFHNVTLATPEGSTQIDHIIVSRFGVFVVETKHFKGWIFGRENQPYWTQKIYRRSFRFQNPLRQNYKHVAVIRETLEVPVTAVRSVVVFTGDCELKTPMPANVTRPLSFIAYIQSFQELVLNDAQVEQLCEQIRSQRLAPGWKTHRDHVRSLKERHR